jgi:DNA-binding NarL/FixJ family response regulator
MIELVQLVGRHREAEQATAQVIARLTPREREVLMALAEGSSDREIAQQLFVSRDTVHTHMIHLLGKLGVDSRTQALLFAIRSGLITLE